VSPLALGSLGAGMIIGVAKPAGADAADALLSTFGSGP
jgi:hypothetical protein